MIARYLRLLPMVAVLGAGVLVVKGMDIVHAAQAAPADPDAPDNSGLAPTDNGGAPARPDFANADGTSPSAAEVDVLSSLTRRRAELDARERALNMRENLLNASEGKIEQKIAALKALQTQIQGLLAQRDAKQDAQIASLVKTYSAMKPKDAARIFNALGDDVLLPVAKGMKSDVLAPVMAAMNPDAAQKLTVKLAALLKLPETPSAICPTPGPITADATTPATPAAAPLQTASLGNPPVTLTPSPAVTPLPTPPAPPPAAAAPAPAQATPAPVQAATPPKPRKVEPHHSTPVKTASAPVKSAPTAAPAPAKPVATPPAKDTASATPPVKATVTPATTTPAPAVTAPATAKPTVQATATPAPLAPPASPPAK